MAPDAAVQHRKPCDSSIEQDKNPDPGPLSNQAPSTKYKTISCTLCRKRKLKCDRVKPSCGTCTRLRHECIYPTARMKTATKRRNVKDLEARLAQVESLLTSETTKATARKASTAEEDSDSDNPDDVPMGMDADLGIEIDRLAVDSFTQELISYGLEENLPSRDIVEELHQIYFQKVHSFVPIVHRYRYLSGVILPPTLGPPLCLRYIIWSLAASVSEKYSDLQDVFYKRARKYAELDEMKSQGECFITVGHAQAWVLLAHYEAQNMFLARSWVSVGRSIRLAQMLGLHRLDGDGEEAKRILPPPRDWVELEERRRCFWGAFLGDRQSTSGTGWPLQIDERDILTKLPASEDAYEEGIEEMTPTLTEAMTVEGASKVSAYAGVVLMASIFGHNWIHLHRSDARDHPEDYANGEFWKRHRRMDNLLSNMVMCLPDHLRLPAGIRNTNVVYLNMNIHSATICLHQSAVIQAESHDLDSRVIRQSQDRCRIAAEEIANIMRLTSHFNVEDMNIWMSFHLYVASGVLIEGCKNAATYEQSSSNLEFLVTAMQAISKKHKVTKSFLMQLKLDLELAGVPTSLGRPEKIVTEGFESWQHGHPRRTKKPKSRSSDKSPDGVSQSMFLRGYSSSASVAGSSRSSNPSHPSPDNLSEPPQDLNNRPIMEGVLSGASSTTGCRVFSEGQIMPNDLNPDFGTFSYQRKQSETNFGYIKPQASNAPPANILSSHHLEMDDPYQRSQAEAVVNDPYTANFNSYIPHNSFYSPPLPYYQQPMRVLQQQTSASYPEGNNGPQSRWTMYPFGSVPIGAGESHFNVQGVEDFDSMLAGTWDS